FYNLGKIEYVSSRYDLARDFTERSLAMFEEIGDRVATSSVLGLLGQITADAGNPAGSLAMFAESLSLRLTLGLHRHLAEFIEQIAAAAVSLDAAAVTRWLAAADQDYRRSGIERLPREQAALEHMIEQATAALGPDRF